VCYLGCYSGRWSLVVVLISMALTACGGGGGSSESLPTTAPGTGSAILSWNAVQTNVDGTPYTDPGGYRIYYGEISPVTKVNSLMVDTGNVTTAVIGGLPSGHVFYFRVSAYDQSGNESDLSSEEKSKAIP